MYVENIIEINQKMRNKNLWNSSEPYNVSHATFSAF